MSKLLQNIFTKFRTTVPEFCKKKYLDYVMSILRETESDSLWSEYKISEVQTNFQIFLHIRLVTMVNGYIFDVQNNTLYNWSCIYASKSALYKNGALKNGWFLMAASQKDVCIT